MLVISPLFVFAQLFDPGDKGIVGGICEDGVICEWKDLVQAAKNILGSMLFVSIPLATIAFAYSGFLILTAGPNSGQVEKGKLIFYNVTIGFVIILSAWLIVYTVVAGLIGRPNDFFDSTQNPFI